MKVPTIHEIIIACANHFSVPVEIIVGGSARSKQVILIRQIAMYLARNLTFQSLSQVAKQFGGAQSGTVRYAENKISELMFVDDKLREELDAIKSSLGK